MNTNIGYMYDVSIVIVNYNVRDLVDNCISSIYSANNKNHKIEIFFVDNNSIDGSVKYIKEKYPEVKVISNDKNIGFSKANNIALKQASGEYILILNPDTVLEEGTFSKMINFCEQNKDTGAVTSKLILSNGKLDSACKRSFPTFSVALPRIFGLSKLFPKSKIFGKYNLTYLDENKTYEIDSVCGAFMFIPKKILDVTGFFDEDYFMYGEDLDLCFKIKKNGFKVYYYPEVTTIHYKGESTRKTHLSYVNNFYGAMRIFIQKNFTGVPRILSLVAQFGIYNRSFFGYIKRILRILLFPLIDAVIIYVSLVASVYIRFNIFPNKGYLLIISIYVLIWLSLLTLFGLYNVKNHFSIKRTFNAIISGFFINSSITYFFNQYAYSREVILTSTVLSLLIMILWRGIVNISVFFKKKNIMLHKIDLLVVGDKELNQDIEEKLVSKYNVLFFNRIASKKTLSELEEIIQINNIKEVIFSGDYFSNQEILSLMWNFREKNLHFKILPTGKELILSKLHSNLEDISLIEIEYNINNKMNIFLKRVFDLSISLILLIVIYPFVFLYSILSRNRSSRNVSKLMLLPKVFIGKYSLVGIPLWLEAKNNEYLGKKGLTGLIQVNQYKGITGEELEIYSLFYAKNQSLMLDIEILLKTVFSIFKNIN
ncbi:MAG TPA: glycosyltransferase [Ignavibacteria bacterium]